MKILKIISKICLIAAFALFTISPIMEATVTEASSSSSTETIVNPVVSSYISTVLLSGAYYYILAGLGFALILVNYNKITKAIGQGLLGANSMIALVVFIQINNHVAEVNNNNFSIGAGALLILVAAIVYLTYVVLDLVADAINNISEQKTSISPALAEIKQWKELLDQNIINEEEFNIKKQEILNLPKKD